MLAIEVSSGLGQGFCLVHKAHLCVLTFYGDLYSERIRNTNNIIKKNPSMQHLLQSLQIPRFFEKETTETYHTTNDKTKIYSLSIQLELD